jgi:putative redox protein
MAQVTVQSLPDFSFAVLATHSPHGWLIDEAAADGGNDLGPDPYQVLLSALGACTAMTLFMYARRKGWDLQEVAVHVTHDRVHAADCVLCTQEEIDAAGPGGRIELIQKQISLRGDLSEEQVARLLEIADRCPVHRTLEGRPKIVSSTLAGP